MGGPNSFFINGPSFDDVGFDRAVAALRAAGLGKAVYVLGAEADPSLARLVRSTRTDEGAPALLMSLAMIEAMPYSPGGQYSRSDYHGLREISDRPFLMVAATGHGGWLNSAGLEALGYDSELVDNLPPLE